MVIYPSYTTAVKLGKCVIRVGEITINTADFRLLYAVYCEISLVIRLTL